MKDDNMIVLVLIQFFFPAGDTLTNNIAKEGCSEIVTVINSKAALFVSRR